KDAFTYSVSDPSGSTDTATVQVHVIKGGPSDKKLVFPVSINTGSSRLFSDTFVGIGLLNPMESHEEVSLQSLTSQGNTTSNVQLGNSLPPGGQTAFLTTEAMGFTPGSLAMTASSDLGPLQGFFMFGSNDLTKMDGIGGELEDGTDLYLTLAEQGSSQSTLLFLFNSNPEVSPQLVIQLFQKDGTLVARTEAVLAPEGSLMGTLEEIFHEGLEIDGGYVRVQATDPIRAFEILARNENFAAMSGRLSAPATRLFSPHFFVDYTQEGSSHLQLLNTSKSAVDVEIALRDDHSELLTKKFVTIAPGQLFAEDFRSLLAGDVLVGPSGIVTGFVDVQVISEIKGEPSSLLGSVVFEGGANRSLTALPLMNTGSTSSLFPHVAQSKSAAIFTGFALLNPGSKEAQVTITIFDEEGGYRTSKNFTIAPYSRHIDMLDGADFFGPDFEQIKGHVRIESTEAVITFAIVGDYRGEYFSAIEAQTLPEE
ncbi:MAG TPA: hypothetical protein VKZ59_01865, partial [Acidobacteriota bacterium]|nr:hypothetical protein [Acidobacteriota bacterium]